MSDSDGPEFDDGLSPDLGGSVSQAADGELDPDHPLLQRAQTALKKQLLNTRKEIEDKIRARREHLERERRHRESVGVELYAAQQTLSRLQTQLETTES
jgi:hypothetical protein